MIEELITCNVCNGTGTIKQFGHALKIARDKMKWSRQDLADQCGLSYVTIRNIEKGTHNPSETSLRMIHHAFTKYGVILHA